MNVLRYFILLGALATTWCLNSNNELHGGTAELPGDSRQVLTGTDFVYFFTHPNETDVTHPSTGTQDLTLALVQAVNKIQSVSNTISQIKDIIFRFLIETQDGTQDFSVAVRENLRERLVQAEKELQSLSTTILELKDNIDQYLTSPKTPREINLARKIRNMLVQAENKIHSLTYTISQVKDIIFRFPKDHPDYFDHFWNINPSEREKLRKMLVQADKDVKSLSNIISQVQGEIFRWKKPIVPKPSRPQDLEKTLAESLVQAKNKIQSVSNTISQVKGMLLMFITNSLKVFEKSTKGDINIILEDRKKLRDGLLQAEKAMKSMNNTLSEVKGIIFRILNDAHLTISQAELKKLREIVFQAENKIQSLSYAISQVKGKIFTLFNGFPDSVSEIVHFLDTKQAIDIYNGERSKLFICFSEAEVAIESWSKIISQVEGIISKFFPDFQKTYNTSNEMYREEGNKLREMLVQTERKMHLVSLIISKVGGIIFRFVIGPPKSPRPDLDVWKAELEKLREALIQAEKELQSMSKALSQLKGKIVQFPNCPLDVFGASHPWKTTLVQAENKIQLLSKMISQIKGMIFPAGLPPIGVGHLWNFSEAEREKLRKMWLQVVNEIKLLSYIIPQVKGEISGFINGSEIILPPSPPQYKILDELNKLGDDLVYEENIIQSLSNTISQIKGIIFRLLNGSPPDSYMSFEDRKKCIESLLQAEKETLSLSIALYVLKGKISPFLTGSLIISEHSQPGSPKQEINITLGERKKLRELVVQAENEILLLSKTISQVKGIIFRILTGSPTANVSIYDLDMRPINIDRADRYKLRKLLVQAENEIKSLSNTISQLKGEIFTLLPGHGNDPSPPKDICFSGCKEPRERLIQLEYTIQSMRDTLYNCKSYI